MDLQSLDGGFDPLMSINSGQVFLWEKRGNSWYGIHGDSVVKIYFSNGKTRISSFPDDNSCAQEMFRLGDDTNKIFLEISRDPLIHELVNIYPGLRLMRQEPHQCLFSFVCASNTNIPMIRRMLCSLTRKFGKPLKVDGFEFFTFPSATAINRASISDLRACGLGYRTKAMKIAAKAIVSGELDFDILINASYEEAKGELLKVYGIGPKIADCVLLFSLEKLNAFPIDIWIRRALFTYYSQLQRRKLPEKITPRQYEELSSTAREYFGKHAGYAQQYLYYHMRQSAGKKW